MKITGHVLSAAAAAAQVANIAPHQNITDVDVLNFALTLEHLENAFYTQGLQNFSAQTFASAGLPDKVREFYVQLAQHEQFHVDNLTTILGSQAVQPCTYDFTAPFNGTALNVTNFIDISDMLETVGTSAYTGAGVYLENKQNLATAAAILATEARQSTWINNAVRAGNPWSTAYETPLDLNQVFTLASGLIVSCPPNNTVVPVTPNPPLSATPPTALPGQNVTLSFPGQPTNTTGLYAAFLNGIVPSFVPLASYTVTIPPQLRGFAYVAVTNSSSVANDTSTVAGPAFFNFSFNSNNTLTPLTN